MDETESMAPGETMCGGSCQARPRPRNPRYVNVDPLHSLALTEDYLSNAAPGTVLSVLTKPGAGAHVPIAFAKRPDGTWEVHSRGGVTADRLVGGRATPRRRAGLDDHAGLSDEVMPGSTPGVTPKAHASFAEAAARMAGG